MFIGRKNELTVLNERYNVIPAIGLAPGEELDFGGLLGSGPVILLRTELNRKRKSRNAFKIYI